MPSSKGGTGTGGEPSKGQLRNGPVNHTENVGLTLQSCAAAH